MSVLSYSRIRGLFAASLLAGTLVLRAADPAKEPAGAPTELIKPAASTGTGLLLEPPLDLSRFTREDFLKVANTVGPERIRRPWTSPVTTLPPHPRTGVKGLTEDEVRSYMSQVRGMFNRGEAVPLSDVGLISTQEDVIRRPMFNHIAAFSNAVARVYLLVQKTERDKSWGYFSIVQDLTLDPPLDYFAEVREKEVKFEGANCYKCHSSGPLSIHPTRADLVADAPLAAAIAKHIAEQPRSRFHFPATDPAPDYGKALAPKFCSRCHSDDGDRGPLFKVHAHPIRILVDFGYMPPNRALKPEEITELKAWLDRKP